MRPVGSRDSKPLRLPSLRGPLFTIAAFLGAAMTPMPNGVLGILVSVIAIFAPLFLSCSPPSSRSHDFSHSSTDVQTGRSIRVSAAK